MAKEKPYRFALYLLARAAAGVVYILPRRTALASARLLGRLAFFAIRRHREKALENLKEAYGEGMPPAQREETARRVFEHLAQTSAEVLQFPKLNLRKLESFIDMGEAYSLYESLLAEGKGLISITAHIGNWELLAGLFGLPATQKAGPSSGGKGFRGAVVGRRIYYAPYNRWIVGLRQAVGVRTLFRKESAREILELLSRNEIVGLLPDQDIDSLRGVFVDFFGRPAYTPVAPVRLALASGAPLVANFLIREPGDRYRFISGGVIRPVVETTREEAVRKYTAEWMRSFEEIIRQYPDQWAWMHPRWKTKPGHFDERSDVISSEARNIGISPHFVRRNDPPLRSK